jgi:hypothetical protein
MTTGERGPLEAAPESPSTETATSLSTGTDKSLSRAGSDFATLLAATGRAGNERLSVNHKSDDGTFVSEITTAANAPAVAARYADRDCWYGSAVLHDRVKRGRGAAKDVVGLRELSTDLDVKPGGMHSWAAAEQVIADLSDMLGVEPVAVVHTGHGLQPHWVLERDAGTDWENESSPQWLANTKLWRRWGRFVVHVAEKQGGSVDTVSDLSRLFRTPGTTNRKRTPVPVTMTLTAGSLLSLKRLAETLDEYGIPEVAEDAELLDEVTIPESKWTFADDTCAYVRQMVKGWETDRPGQRHPWLVSQATRLAAAHRAGCISEADHGDAVKVLTRRLRTRLNVGSKRGEHPGEITGALAWATMKVSTFQTSMVLAELGDHEHASRAQPREYPVVALDDVHEVFTRWLGQAYDLDVLDAVLAATAAGLVLDGDPTNLLVVGGSGAAKTETVSPLAAAGAIVTSTISSEGALLSGTSARETSSAATGGLLRKVGNRGVLVLKDFTSILCMNRDSRSAVLAAMREVSDGYWERNLGVDGGKSLQWRGRCTIIGAVTTSWDQAHSVIASMGDRFPLIRMPEDNALEAGSQALANTGSEDVMREELGAAVGGLLQHLEAPEEELIDFGEFILPVANIVTWGRTAVMSNYKGDVVTAHAREMPTRFAKQLAQLYRGSRCIGLSDQAARRIVLRVARDTLPPMRRIVLARLLKERAYATSGEIARRVNKPRTSVDQQLQALVSLGLARLDQGLEADGEKEVWRWRLADSVDQEALGLLVTGNVQRPHRSAPSGRNGRTNEEPLGVSGSTSIENTSYDDVSRQEEGPADSFLPVGGTSPQMANGRATRAMRAT